jgi:hypothetical protein
MESKTPYEQDIIQEEESRLEELSRTSNLLMSKTTSNQVANAYYIQLRALLEDILMLELAQKTTEVSLMKDTYSSIISINESSLKQFREEMEKAKTLKLITGILSITGSLNLEDNLQNVSNKIYGVESKPIQKDSFSSLKKDIKDMFENYLQQLETNLHKENLNDKRNSMRSKFHSKRTKVKR